MYNNRISHKTYLYGVNERERERERNKHYMRARCDLNK